MNAIELEWRTPAEMTACIALIAYMVCVYVPEEIERRRLCSETLAGRGFQPIEQMNEGAGNEDSKNL
jgi:hypothetical protein